MSMDVTQVLITGEGGGERSKRTQFTGGIRNDPVRPPRCGAGKELNVVDKPEGSTGTTGSPPQGARARAPHSPVCERAPCVRSVRVHRVAHGERERASERDRVREREGERDAGPRGVSRTGECGLFLAPAVPSTVTVRVEEAAGAGIFHGQRRDITVNKVSAVTGPSRKSCLPAAGHVQCLPATGGCLKSEDSLGQRSIGRPCVKVTENCC
ncbi:hypothetical protein AGIG_G8087 [Arapaima gigas]